MLRLKCLNCGNDFDVSPSRENTAKYCSLKCHNESMQNRVKRICAYCGNEFEQREGRHSANKRYFCSSDCYHKSGGKGKRGNYFICVVCKQRFYRPKANSRNAKYCSVDCMAKGYRDPTGDVKKNIRKCGKYLEWVKEVFERDNYHCQDCGKGGKLVAHHNVISFIDLWNQMLTEFDSGDLYEFAINYQPLWETNNGLTLCTDCHGLRHSTRGVETERQAPRNGMMLQSDTRSNSGICFLQINKQYENLQVRQSRHQSEMLQHLLK